MEVRGKKFVTIYLTDWQKRMVKDFLGVECDTWTVAIDSGPVIRYFGPGVSSRELDPKAKRMYFTDWQKREIKDVTGEECDFVELHPDVIAKYMGPPMAQIGDLLTK